MSNAANVLPDIDEPKMKILGKQLNRNRKTSIIYHDKMKDQLNVYTRSMENDKRHLAGKYQLNSVRLKKRLAYVRGTQKCLRRRREQTFFEDSEEYPYGVYEGERLSSYRHEIENIIQEKHPKERRLRKVEQQMKTGKITGRILDDKVARIQFERLMTKDYSTKGIASGLIRTEQPLGITCTFRKDKEPCKPIPQPTPSPLFNKISRDPRSTEPGSLFEENWTPSPSPTKLCLPPILAKKDLVKSINRQPSKFLLPNLMIRRASKGTIVPEEIKSSYGARFNKRPVTTFV